MRLLVYLFLFSVANASYAVSFLSFDPSSMATGGAGSVTGASGPQPFLSPATYRHGEYCCALRAYGGARLIDRQHFLSTARSIRDWHEELNLEERLDAAENALDPNHLQSGALRNLGTTADQLVTALNSLPDKPLRIGASAGLYALGQNNRIAAGAFNRRYLILGSLIKNDPQDMQSIATLQSTLYVVSDLIDDVNHIGELIETLDQNAIEELVRSSFEAAALDPQLLNHQEIPGVAPLIQALTRLEQDIRRLEEHADLRQLVADVIQQNLHIGTGEPSFADIDVRDYLHHQIPERINSTILFSGAEVEEAGINFSFAIPDIPELTLGINVKEMAFSTIDFVQRLDQFDIDEYQSEATRKDYRFWNLDLGVRYQLTQHWTAGAVFKNLRSKQMFTVRQ